LFIVQKYKTFLNLRFSWTKLAQICDRCQHFYT